MAEVVVLMSALLLADLQKSEPTQDAAAQLTTESGHYKARSNLALATPNPDASDSYFVTFILDEQAGEFAESIKSVDGVLSVFVKPDLGQP